MKEKSQIEKNAEERQIELLSTASVSYTHLDVYKRQEKQMRGVLELTIPARQHICFDTGREGWNFAQTLQKEICRTIRSTIEETPERKPYRAVSYTHLDVYKRQDLMRKFLWIRPVPPRTLRVWT